MKKTLKCYKGLFLQTTSVLPVNRFIQLYLMITQHTPIFSWFYAFLHWCQVFNGFGDSLVRKDTKSYRVCLFCFVFFSQYIECLCRLHILQKLKSQETQLKDNSSDLLLNFTYSRHECSSLSLGRCPSCLFNCQPRGKMHNWIGIKIMPVHDIQTLQDKIVIGILNQIGEGRNN